jgi:plasmid stabilization system protein ParE
VTRLRLRVTLRAAREIERAEAWWRQNRPAAPAAPREDLKTALDLLVQEPGIGVKVANARLLGARRLHLKRVRYFIYYRVSGDELIVLSVWHASRGNVPVV